MTIGTRKTSIQMPLIEGLPINVNLYAASHGVVDLGDPYPEEILVQADLESNSGYKIGLLGNRCSSAMVGTNFAAAKTGLGFTNQPQNDGLELLSDTVADVSRVVTIYGTTTGTNIVVMEQVTLHASDGTTVVSSVKTDWGYILGVEVSAAHATAVITIREASGNAAVTTIAATATQTGMVDVIASLQQSYGLPFRAVGSDTTTKVVGVVGTNSAGTAVYDAVTLSNTTAVCGVVGMNTVTKLLYGDLEATRTATFDIGNLTPGASAERMTTLGASDTGYGRRIGNGGRYLHWCLANGVTLATGGVNDWLRVKVWR